MKHIFCSLCFFILSIISFSQSDSLPSDTSKNKKHSKYSIGIIISRENTFRTLVDTVSWVFGSMAVADSIDLVELPKTAINFGIDFSLVLSKHFTFKTGLLFKDMGYSNKGFFFYDEVAREMRVYKDSKTEKAKFMFTELPLILDFGFKSKNQKWRLGIFSGFLMSLNINKFYYKSRFYIAYSKSGNGLFKAPAVHDKFSTMRLGISSGLSLSYFPSKKLMISLSPVFKNYFETFYASNFGNTYITYDEVPVTLFGLHEKPYSYGCSIGINYLFGRK